MTNNKIPITVAEGDGIGPEIMKATLKILEAAECPLDIHRIEIGEKVYLQGQSAGIAPETWDTIRKTKAFLKAPITTPQGGGFKSLNVTIRTALGLYANVRPCISYHPIVLTKHPVMDVVIVRENEEDLYIGIEYQQSQGCVHALKVISHSGSEKIIRYAFEYAKANFRKKVTCFTKDNILKKSDGLFHKIFDQIAKEYPDIENEHWIVDIGAAKLAATPEAFDVVVMPNLYGDILSDVAAQITGSVGLAGSANIGPKGAMFEAIHGSAPRRAGQDLANPSGLLLAAVMMLVHLGLTDHAAKIHNALLKTLEDGIHTYDIFKEGTSKEKVGTQAFADAVIARLGQKPKLFKEVKYTEPKSTAFKDLGNITEQKKETVGVDVFVDFNGSPEELGKKMKSLEQDGFKLKMITNRGSVVWPTKHPETTCIDNWRCRYVSATKGVPVTHAQIAALLAKLATSGVDFVQTENLCTFNGVPGYTLSQDEQ
jgi:isocitrate dehydrogenase